MARQSCWTELYLRAGVAAFKVLLSKGGKYIKRRINWYQFVAAGSSRPLYSPFIFLGIFIFHRIWVAEHCNLKPRISSNSGSANWKKTARQGRPRIRMNV